jgi:D-alanyl-lipoteichoic acid acyltransferase DltB (MBOAT superfamily)
LVCASFFFYAWWNPFYLILIAGSLLLNYAAGVALSSNNDQRIKKVYLTAGIAANLGLLAYYKYTHFFIDNLNYVFGTSYHLKTILLPLAISFFTFQQVAYLVDVYKGYASEHDFVSYCLFVTFFPQLIAGPIVHHNEMLPQFGKDLVYRLNYEHLAVGITGFIIGLFKKVVLADGVERYASAVFNAAELGTSLTLIEAWIGALAYSFQLYFDFSGYCDMSIGLAMMFGIRLPLNFFSPYKSINIIEFWRRWHMTLARFLKNYLYIPLGGNRKGKFRRYLNMMVTMLLGGLWHGAAWTFVFWGAFHGLCLIINHIWHDVRILLGHNLKESSRLGRLTARLVTFMAVVIGWVLFRSESLDGAMNILGTMFGSNLISLALRISDILSSFELGMLVRQLIDILFVNHLFVSSHAVLMTFVLLVIAFCLPNTQQLLKKYNPTVWNNHFDETSSLSINSLGFKEAILISLILTQSIYSISATREFVYFVF